jgi:hypothetical protein
MALSREGEREREREREKREEYTLIPSNNMAVLLQIQNSLNLYRFHGNRRG